MIFPYITMGQHSNAKAQILLPVSIALWKSNVEKLLLENVTSLWANNILRSYLKNRIIPSNYKPPTAQLVFAFYVNGF